MLIFCQGLEFIAQLCVEDDERAGTLVAASNKFRYPYRIFTKLTPTS
jgi:hypothetical protein